MSSAARIMIVEDEMILAMDLQDRLERLGHTVVATVARGEEAIVLAARLKPELILMDIRLQGDLDGIDTASRIRAKQDCPIIFLTAFADDTTVQRVTATDPFGYLHKPCDERSLRTAIEIALMKHRKERKLQEQESRYQQALNSIGEAIIVLDPFGRVNMLNQAAETLTGFDLASAVRQPVDVIFPLIEESTQKPKELPWQICLKSQRRVPLPQGWAMLRTQETPLPITGELTPILPTENHNSAGILVTFHDSQQRRNVEERLRYGQKLESLGILAGGVAHDFNNLLTPILGYASLTLGMIADDSPLQPMLVQIEQAARKAADLTQQILAYSGKGRTILQQVDISSLVREMSGLLGSISGRTRVEFELADALPWVRADASQLKQVILNLVTNAHEALLDQVGVITIKTELIDVTETVLLDPFSPRELPGGEYVVLEVGDTGKGIPQENINRIFDPFFTTKFTGRGLGLSAAQGIVRGHDGILTVESQTGLGTKFRVLLPKSKDRYDRLPAARKPTSLPNMQGTILLVEDDAAVRNLVQMILNRLGYEVIQANDTDEALMRLMEKPQIKLSLVDLHTPGMEVTEWIRKIRSLGWSFPIILMSGNATDVMDDQFRQHGFAGFVQKPFSFEELRHQLQSITHS
jgi:two-component system, cell cycle sensor histidine kinase and response regulator CckA